MNREVTATPPTARRWVRRGAVIVVWVAAVVVYQVWASRNGLGPGDAAVELVDTIKGSTWGPLALILAYVIRPLLLFSAALLTIAAGFLFGPIAGVVIVIVGANASAMIAYGIGRWFGTGTSSTTEIGERLARYTTRLRTRSFETTLILRLLFVPFDLVSYAAGLSRIHPGAFLAGTAIGSIPGTLAFVLVGASIEEFDGGVPSINPWTVVASVGLLVISLIIVRVVRRWEGAGVGDA